MAQVQHGTDLQGGRQTFTYGLDYFSTNPQTHSTINGSYEDADETREYGSYVQSQTQLGPRFDLVLAGSLDTHSALPDPLFSPRAALVFKPIQDLADLGALPPELAQYLDGLRPTGAQIRQDFVTPLTVSTPLLAMNGLDIVQFLVPGFMQEFGYDQATATNLAISVAGGIARVPLGVITSPDISGSGAQLLATYTKFRSYPGAPVIGRMAMLRLRYVF